jgi:hypothetical protein
MVNKFKERALKAWNMISGKDANMDGEVDIKDKMLQAEQKAKSVKDRKSTKEK